MAFLSVRIRLDGLDAEAIDAIEAACFAAGAHSVTFTDQRDDAILEPAPGEFRLWPATRLEAVFDAGIADAAWPDEFAAQLGRPLAALELAPIADRVWEREWLRDFRPLRFGRRLWVCPHELEPPADARADPATVLLRLDPGLAFGTGTHATTAMCLAWLEATVSDSTARVIDYGCGSGILAIAALRLGAARAAGYDIDPQALIATRDNALANDVAGRLDIVATDAGLQPGADLVVANILAGPLVDLAPRLAALCAPGGQLALAGLLDAQADEVLAAYRPWFDIGVQARRDGWTCLAGSRRDAMSVRIGAPSQGST
jgi:ribosomal protein L11 methyltransferase